MILPTQSLNVKAKVFYEACNVDFSSISFTRLVLTDLWHKRDGECSSAIDLLLTTATVDIEFFVMDVIGSFGKNVQS